MIDRRFIPASHRRPVFAAVEGQPHLKRFIGFEGDPGTPTAKRSPMRRVGLSGLSSSTGRENSLPARDGSPGPMMYDERQIWGTDNPMGSVTSPPDPSTPMPAIQGPTQMDPGISIPFGVSIIKWRNPTTMQSVPILPSTPANVPVLSLNMSRNALVIQNNSTATSPDVAPNFYIGFNAQPQQGLALTLAPLAGILFDIITPRDAIYVLIAGGSGASQIIQGVVVQGTYAPL